jgi:hypothetical protein
LTDVAKFNIDQGDESIRLHAASIPLPLTCLDSLLDLLTLEVLSEFTALVRLTGDLIMALFVLLLMGPLCQVSNPKTAKQIV